MNFSPALQLSDTAAERPALVGRPVTLGSAYLTPGMGGISRLARLTAFAVAKSGCDLSLLSLLDQQPVALDGVPARLCKGSKAAFAARCLIDALRPRHFIYESAGIARGHARLGPFTRPCALWMCGIEVWSGLRPQTHATLRRADARFAISHFTLRRHQELHGDPGPASVCWLATDEDHAPDVAPGFGGPPTALLLGRIDELSGFKGHAEVVEAWPKVVAAVPEARLVFAGGGAGLPRLRELVAQSRVASQIEVKGFVAEEALPDLWRQAHVLAMPSRKEGFGFVYIEAMRQGLPVIASIHDAGAEVNLDGKTGYNVDLDRPAQLAERLIALLRDPDKARAMGQAGQQRWREHFRFSSFMQRFQPLLAKFVEMTS